MQVHPFILTLLMLRIGLLSVNNHPVGRRACGGRSLRTRWICNQKHALRHQCVVECHQEQQGDNYDYSNSDLRNVINIGRDAHSLIICRQQEQEGIVSYNPTSNYRIPEDYSRPPRKRWHVNVDSRTSRDQRRAKAASAEEHFNNLLDSKCRWQPKGNHSVFKCKPKGTYVRL